METSYYIPEDTGFLRFGDTDRVDFINRQSTNDIQTMAVDTAITTVITTPTARILDVLQLIQEADAIGAVTLPGRTGATYDYFRRRIFFNDKVSLKNVSDEIHQVLLEGHLAGEWLAQFEVVPPQLHKIEEGSLQDIRVKVVGQPGLYGAGFRLLFDGSQKADVKNMLETEGVSELKPDVYEYLRIEAGLPGPLKELSQDFTPLEVGLEWAINHNKGCYTGQEVIARQVNYEKITRKMAGVVLSGPVESSDRVFVEGRTAGEITSYTLSPNFGPIALAVIKRPYFDIGTKVIVHSQGSDVKGEVVPLPFPK